MVDRDFARQLNGKALTTAHILYHLPDHPALLQTFTWQCYDLAPGFPRLHRFLDYWVENIDGLLHSVTVGSAALISPREFRMVDGEFRLH